MDTWENFKIQVAKISWSYGKMQASRRRTIIEIGKQMKTKKNDEETLEKLIKKKKKFNIFT